MLGAGFGSRQHRLHSSNRCVGRTLTNDDPIEQRKGSSSRRLRLLSERVRHALPELGRIVRSCLPSVFSYGWNQRFSGGFEGPNDSRTSDFSESELLSGCAEQEMLARHLQPQCSSPLDFKLLCDMDIPAFQWLDCGRGCFKAHALTHP